MGCSEYDASMSDEFKNMLFFVISWAAVFVGSLAFAHYANDFMNTQMYGPDWKTANDVN